MDTRTIRYVDVSEVRMTERVTLIFSYQQMWGRCADSVDEMMFGFSFILNHTIMEISE